MKKNSAILSQKSDKQHSKPIIDWLLFTALQKTQFCEQQHAPRCTDMGHYAPYRAGCLGIFMRKRIKTPRGTVAVNSNVCYYFLYKFENRC